MMAANTCEFEGCGRPVKARGLCTGHYEQRRRGRDLTALVAVSPRSMTLAERLEARSEVTTRGCRLWTGTVNPETGYGSISVQGTARGVHVVAYELANGPVPLGHVVDHRCRTRTCINPAHLHAATQKQNSENRGASRSSKSGVRGVYLHKASGLWHGLVTHNGMKHSAGYFRDLDEADTAVRELRAQLFTNSDLGEVR